MWGRGVCFKGNGTWAAKAKGEQSHYGNSITLTAIPSTDVRNICEIDIL